MRRIFYLLICLFLLSACTSEKERSRPDSDVAIIDQDTSAADTNDTEIPPEDTSPEEDIDEATDPCDPNPCMNDGTCAENDDTFTCTCPAGFTGETCQTTLAPCDLNPCMNDGTCAENDDDTFTCTCPAGFTGETCQTTLAPCDPNPCMNDGTCAENDDTFTCTCPTGFVGERCQHPDPCDPNPCMNNGICDTFGGSTAHCMCLGGWHGSTCEQCGTACSGRPDYYRDRFLHCYRDTDFCDRLYATCEEFCSGWMGCEGPLEINSDGITTVTGPDEECN